VLSVGAELLGEETMGRVFASLPSDEREKLRYHVINTGWYPVSLYRTLLGAIMRTSGEGYELVRRIGAGAIRRDVTGVYRLVFKILSPETIFSVTGRFFNTYYDTGAIRVQGQHHSARAVYEGCVGFDQAMWEELAGSGEELFRLAGGKDPKLTIVRGGQDGHAHCEMIGEWR
jgi:hypothetical protein